MKFFIRGILFYFSILGVYAQTGIGTATPNASAKLEVYATDKGFLPPRIALTATNAASPISSPANGLMVFNTASAGASPFNVVPGYYYWDGTGQQWVSLSTTVGNVQNQAIFRSTASTTYSGTVSSWATRFNNVAPGDLTFLSSTTFALSNGIYKIQWGLPYQTTQTYNLIQLQENISGTWTPWKNDIVFANLGNGGNTEWGGGTFMTDVIDCSTSTKTLRLVNGDGSRILLAGASFIITKLNPSITTSTTADNLGDHTATKNILLNGNYLSNDGGNEGIRIDNSGKVGIGTATPTTALDVTGDAKVSGILTAGGNTYPAATGTNGQALTTNGTGAASWNPVPPPGVITAFAGSTAPTGYLICDGAAVSRTTYAALFTIIGTTYGAGNGSTTFNVPDLRSKTIVGVGQGTGLTNRTLASTGGAETKTLSVTEMPSHNHSINDPGHAHSQTTINDDFNNSGGNAPGFSADGAGSKTWTNINTSTTGITINSNGSGAAFNIMNPFLALNYIIKF